MNKCATPEQIIQFIHKYTGRSFDIVKWDVSEYVIYVSVTDDEIANDYNELDFVCFIDDDTIKLFFSSYEEDNYSDEVFSEKIFIAKMYPLTREYKINNLLDEQE